MFILHDRRCSTSIRNSKTDDVALRLYFRIGTVDQIFVIQDVAKH
jgi:hypothetical protein